MPTPNRVNYYTYHRIPDQKISQSGMDDLVRMVNERFEDISTKLYGNLEYKDLNKAAKTDISKSATDVTSEDVKINKTDGLRIDTVLSSGGTTTAVYFQAKGTQIGLYRTSDNKQLWGGKLLASGQVVTVTSALIDPDGDGSSYCLLVTDGVNTSLKQFQNSYEGATEEENPTPVASVAAISIGSSNTGTYGISSWVDGFLSWFRGKGGLTVSAEKELDLTVYEDGSTATASMNLGEAYHPAGAAAFGCHAIPKANNAYALGSSAYALRWTRLYCVQSLDVSSDERLKQDIQDIDPSLIFKLRPRSFRLKADPAKMHYGLIAQEVKAALDECGIENADLYGDENPDSLSLRYEQLIAPLIATVQAQEKRIKKLEATLGGTA
jgi:hypothetical protein